MVSIGKLQYSHVYSMLCLRVSPFRSLFPMCSLSFRPLLYLNFGSRLLLLSKQFFFCTHTYTQIYTWTHSISAFLGFFLLLFFSFAYCWCCSITAALHSSHSFLLYNYNFTLFVCAHRKVRLKFLVRSLFECATTYVCSQSEHLYSYIHNSQ